MHETQEKELKLDTVKQAGCEKVVNLLMEATLEPISFTAILNPTASAI